MDNNKYIFFSYQLQAAAVASLLAGDSNISDMPGELRFMAIEAFYAAFSITYRHIIVIFSLV